MVSQISGEVSTLSWFVDDPHFAWGFFGHRSNLYKSTQPHKGFAILKNWSESKECRSFIFTTNVDGHFQKAGFSEHSMVECHGSFACLQKVDGRSDIWALPDEFRVVINEETLQAKDPLPHGPPGLCLLQRSKLGLPQAWCILINFFGSILCLHSLPSID